MEVLEGQSHTSDEELYELIDERILEYGQAMYLPLKERVELRSSLFDSFRRLGALQELVDDREVTEIMVNGPDHIFVERKGRVAVSYTHLDVYKRQPGVRPRGIFPPSKWRWQ